MSTPLRPPVARGTVASMSMTIKAPLTADFLWIVHRAALGGKSSVTGAELPASLDGCPPGARAAHYAMALAAARHVDPGAAIPVPAGVTPEEAERIERVVAEIIGA
jgi:hypothetical protein